MGIFSFAITYTQTDKEELEKMEKAGEGIAKPFVIPNDLLLADPEEMYLLLCEAADESKVIFSGQTSIIRQMIR